jgi:predicted nucleic acid-binding Zn ribbon protein
MTEKRSSTDFVHIGQVLSSVLKSCGRAGDQELSRIWSLWPQVVDEIVAQNTRPAAIKADLLLVNVSSSPWIHRLQFLKQDIIEELNTALGKTVVKDMAFKIGPLK